MARSRGRIKAEDVDDPPLTCPDCSLHIRSWNGWNQHLKERGPLFAYYDCSECGKWWYSAHAYCRSYQECKNCGYPVYPSEAQYKKKKEEDEEQIDPTKHHLADLCERCKKGLPCSSLKKAAAVKAEFSNRPYMGTNWHNHKKEKESHSDSDDSYSDSHSDGDDSAVSPDHVDDYHSFHVPAAPAPRAPPAYYEYSQHQWPLPTSGSSPGPQMSSTGSTNLSWPRSPPPSSSQPTSSSQRSSSRTSPSPSSPSASSRSTTSSSIVPPSSSSSRSTRIQRQPPRFEPSRVEKVEADKDDDALASPLVSPHPQPIDQLRSSDSGADFSSSPLVRHRCNKWLCRVS